LLDNGSIIMFPQQRIRLKKQCIVYGVTSIHRQYIQKRSLSHGNEPTKQSNGEGCDKSTDVGRFDQNLLQGENSPKEYRIRQNREDARRKRSGNSEVKLISFCRVVIVRGYEVL
jgi:hypothetical protein